MVSLEQSILGRQKSLMAHRVLTLENQHWNSTYQLLGILTWRSKRTEKRGLRGAYCQKCTVLPVCCLSFVFANWSLSVCWWVEDWDESINCSFYKMNFVGISVSLEFFLYLETENPSSKTLLQVLNEHLISFQSKVLLEIRLEAVWRVL